MRLSYQGFEASLSTEDLTALSSVLAPFLKGLIAPMAVPTASTAIDYRIIPPKPTAPADE